MSRLTKFSKLVFATLVVGSSLSTFVSSHSVQADTLDTNYQDSVKFIPPSSARPKLEQKTLLFQKQKLLKPLCKVL